MDHLQAIAKMFLDRSVDEQMLLASRADEYGAYGLEDAQGVRPTVPDYRLPVDVERLRAIHAAVSRSELAGKRLGSEWTPRETKPLRKVLQDEAWVNTKLLEPFHSECTNFCTRRYFPRARTRLNMVLNVLHLFGEFQREAGMEAGIMFKGGVVIRLILLEFLQSLPVEARIEAQRYLHDNGALSISDLDFEITRPLGKEGDADATHRMVLSHFAVLMWLMRAMSLETRVRERGGRQAHLMSTNWTADEEAAEGLRGELQAVADRLARDHPLYGASIDAVFLSDHVPEEHRDRLGHYRSKDGHWHPRRRESFALFQRGDERCVISAKNLFAHFGMHDVVSEYASPFYATCNQYIGEDIHGVKEHDEMKSVLFHLSRIKHAFVMYYTVGGQCRCDRLGGEMIDLSLSDVQDEFRPFMYASCQARGVPLYISYRLTGAPGMTCTSLSSFGFLADLEKMLHYERQRAYNSLKYQKRILRYCCFLCIVVLGPDVGGTRAQKLDALRALRARFAQPITLFLASRPLSTGVEPVDYFCARERRTLMAMANADPTAASQITAYLQTIHRHLDKLCAIVTRPESASYIPRILLSEVVNVRRHERQRIP